MKYLNFDFYKNIREQELLRNSFYELTQKVMCFDLREWYEQGHWGEDYTPYVLADQGKVISCVAVSNMKFQVDGQIRSFHQIGTVMTDPEYRGRGLNRFLIESVIEDYEGITEGIYLFGNDSVVNYYPKFGFRVSKEYSYSLDMRNKESVVDKNDIVKNGTVKTGTVNNDISYTLVKTDLTKIDEMNHFKENLKELRNSEKIGNDNDGFFVFDNTGLLFYWLQSGYASQVYRIKGTNSYVVAGMEESILVIQQILSLDKVNIRELANAFSHLLQKEVTEVHLEYTPADACGMLIKEHKEEDSTLFMRGDSLSIMEDKNMRFAKFSHA